MDYMTLIAAIIYGALSGIFTGAMGFAKTIIPQLKSGRKVEKIDYNKLAQTIILGAIVGAFAGYKGIPFEEAQILLFYTINVMGCTAIFDWSLKIIVRSFANWMKKQVKPKKKKVVEEEE